MSLIDDIFDCCGRRFDPMGDPLLHRVPGTQYDVYCNTCWRKSKWGREEALAELVRLSHELGLYPYEVRPYYEDDEPTVCIAHGAFIPCRKDGEHRYTSNPFWVKSVRDYQQSPIEDLTWEPAWEDPIVHDSGCGWETGPVCTCGKDPGRMHDEED